MTWLRLMPIKLLRFALLLAVVLAILVRLDRYTVGRDSFADILSQVDLGLWIASLILIPFAIWQSNDDPRFRRMKTYQTFVFAFVRVIFLMVGAFFVFWTILGLIDITAGFNWGYNWYMVLAGPLLALCVYGAYRLLGLIERIAGGVRP